jgi:hypothetical protein
MTNREMFAKVKNHLLTQKKRSEGTGFCLYRGPNGLKCAIGILIPDSKYHPSLEGRVCRTPEVMAAAELEKENLELARNLQHVHDNFEPEEWSDRLNEVEKEFFHD